MRIYLDILSVSDAHIDRKDERVDMLTLLYETVEQLKPRVLVLNGDWADPWKSTWAEILGTKSWDGLRTLVLKRHCEGLKTVWVNRNHDNNAKQSYLPDAILCGEHREGDFLFMHGWEFDIQWGGIFKIPGIAPLAFWLSRRAPWIMVPLYHALFRSRGKTPRQQKGTTAQDWTPHVGMIHLRARAYAKRLGVTIVVGHTHCPSACDGLVADDGDWEDSFSCVAITGGDIRLMTLGELKACYIFDGAPGCESCGAE